MEEITINNKTVKIEGNWKKPPKPGRYFPIRDSFIERLKIIQSNIAKYNKNTETKKCLLCNDILSSNYYSLNNVIWYDNLIHYIDHLIVPSTEFIDFIYRYPLYRKNKRLKLKSNIVNKKENKYVKLKRNQVAVLDALMIHGGITKKYSRDNKTYKYSEHFGLLDLDETGIDKIIVSGKSGLNDDIDKDILLPKNVPYATDYIYMFHTHPPTPKPGGRIEEGILYEFPSVSDIFHFVEHYNNGQTQGSIVIAPEGLYNIRNLELNPSVKKIKMDNKTENNLYKEISEKIKYVQDKYINLYETQFDTINRTIFYTEIAQNTEPIKEINNVLNKYKIHIDYYPRIKDARQNWIIDTLYLPVYL